MKLETERKTSNYLLTTTGEAEIGKLPIIEKGALNARA